MLYYNAFFFLNLPSTCVGVGRNVSASATTWSCHLAFAFWLWILYIYSKGFAVTYSLNFSWRHRSGLECKWGDGVSAAVPPSNCCGVTALMPWLYRVWLSATSVILSQRRERSLAVPFATHLLNLFTASFGQSICSSKSYVSLACFQSRLWNTRSFLLK